MPAGIGDGSYLYPLVIDDNLKTGDMSSGNVSMNNHTLSQQGFYSNNGDVSSGCGFINSHTIYQCDYPSNSEYMGGYVKRVVLLVDMIL